MDFAIPVDHRVKIKESKNIDKYLVLAKELKKSMEHKDDGNTSCNWCTWSGLQRLGIGNQKKNQDHPNKSQYC